MSSRPVGYWVIRTPKHKHCDKGVVTPDQATMPTRPFSSSARKGHGKIRGKNMTGIMLFLLIIFALWCWCATLWFHTFSPEAGSYRGIPKTICPFTMNGPGVPTFKHRDDLGDIVQQEGFTKGLELGVQHGYYSNAMLSRWPKCVEYHLVDLWGPWKTTKTMPIKIKRDRTRYTKMPWKDSVHGRTRFVSAGI